MVVATTTAAVKGEPPKGTPNPWTAEAWNLTQQMVFFKTYGKNVAAEWAASAGTTLGGEKPHKKKPKDGAPGAPGSRGARGSGADGWSPEFAVVPDGQRRVLQIWDYTGGSGTAPVSGDYVGLTGPVGDITAAIDIRGATGLGWAPVLAIAIDPPPPGADERITELGELRLTELNELRLMESTGSLDDLLDPSSRCILQVVDWTNGTGPKPDVGMYIGPSGFVTDAADAVNIRGPAGDGEGGSNQYDIPFFVGVIPGDGSVIGQFVSTRNLVINADFAVSRAYLGTAPMADITFALTLNGDLIGTLTVSASGNTGAFVASSGAPTLLLMAGDVIQVLAPDTPDATAANLSVMVVASFA